MPLYEYKCTSCGHHFERRQSFHDAPVKECPECGQPVRKLLHPAGIVFKGSGWYITDSRKPEPAAAGAASSSSSSSGDSKPSESTSSTPAKAESSSTKSESAPAKTESPAAPAAG